MSTWDSGSEPPSFSSMDSKFWFLDDVNLFKVMCPHKLGDHIRQGHFKNYKKGEIIYFSDDPASTLYLIANGKVRLLRYLESGEEVVLNILGRGELFGELAILGGGSREEVAEALEKDTMICPVKVEEVRELMKDDQEFSFKIHRLIGLKLRKLERKVESLVFKDVKQRLAEFLFELNERQTAGDDSISHKLTHKDIASLIGTSRQTVTSLLNEWRENEWIQFDRKRYTLLQPEKLKAYL